MASSVPTRDELRRHAKETTDTLELFLMELRSVHKADIIRQVHKDNNDTLHRLDPNLCPSLPQPAVIRVSNADTLNAAIELSNLASPKNSGDGYNPRVAVLNFANRHTPGGGWLNGAVAQEEAICYRSSLSLSLDSREYPLGSAEALYSPYVVIFREDMANGHRMMWPTTQLLDLPVVSVVTVAAINRPATRQFTVQGQQKLVYAKDRERNLTKDKMRLALRMAAKNGHRSIVLGALGCGVFANPPEEVAHCWREVLGEYEFQGNWWRDVWFAVFDPRNEGNYDIFQRILDRKEV